MSEPSETTEKEVREHLLNKDFRYHLTAFLIFMSRNGQPSTTEWLAYEAAFRIVEMAKVLYEAEPNEAQADSKRLDKLEWKKASVRLTHWDPARWEISYSAPEGGYGVPCIQHIPGNKTPREVIDKMEKHHE